MKSTLRNLTILSALGTFAYLYPIYRREKADQLRRFELGSTVVKLPSGEMETVVRGEGTPMLAIHGGGGGYEQGLLLGQTLARDDAYRIIAPSRPGARRTPLTTGRSFARQAYAYRDLLDQQGVDQAVVVGISAGGISAIQFAIDYPERCKALVLVSAITPISRTIHASQGWVGLLKAMMSSDFLMWVLLKSARNGFIRIQGDNVSAFGAQNPMTQVIDNLFPSSAWRDNVINDLGEILALDDLPLERIQAPTLILHGDKDTIVPHEVAVRTAARIPDARFVSVTGGSHLMLGTHEAEIQARFIEFMRECVEV